MQRGFTLECMANLQRLCRIKHGNSAFLINTIETDHCDMFDGYTVRNAFYSLNHEELQELVEEEYLSFFNKTDRKFSFFERITEDSLYLKCEAQGDPLIFENEIVCPGRWLPEGPGLELWQAGIFIIVPIIGLILLFCLVINHLPPFSSKCKRMAKTKRRLSKYAGYLKKGSKFKTLRSSSLISLNGNEEIIETD